MPQNNQTQIQITHHLHFHHHLHSYLQLCHSLLTINPDLLNYLPHVQSPHPQTFLKWYTLNVTNRHSRNTKALYLASAYFHSNENQRQLLLQNKLTQVISKLRAVPPKIKLLLDLDRIARQLTRSINVLHNNQSSQSTQKINNNLHSITSPNEVIKKCQKLIQTVNTYSISPESNTNRNTSTHYKDKKPPQSQQQSQLQQSFTEILKWQYHACILASKVMLEKHSKQIVLDFLKSTKKMIKSSLINVQKVIQLYVFCLNHMCVKLNEDSNVDSAVYFQLELKKLLTKKGNQLDRKMIDSAEKVLKQVRDKTQKEVIRKYSYEKPNNNVKKSNQDNDFLREKANPNMINYFQQNKQLYSQQKLASKYSLHLFRPPQPTQRQLLTTTIRLSLGSRHNVVFNGESQSLNKIKEYQLSLRKRRESRSSKKKCLDGQGSVDETGRTEDNGKRIWEQMGRDVKTTRSSQRLLKRSHQHLFYNHSKTPFTNNYHLSTLPPSLLSSLIQPSPNHYSIYHTIRQKDPHHNEINIMSLENQMFMAPQLIYEKPKITFEQITTDFRLVNKQENQSESSLMGMMVSGIAGEKVGCNVQAAVIVNGELLKMEINKCEEQSELFTAAVHYGQGMTTTIYLPPQQDDRYFTIKQVRTTVESTDLFFELIQQKIKSARTDPTVALLMRNNQFETLRQQNNPLYITYLNIFAAISTICNYLQPYIYWYWNKRSKLNGFVLSRRCKLEMSDPLKFSINLQSFKKNDFAGCLELFKTVRNKKGLKQCITYLSEGRQILCKRLVKSTQGRFSLQTLQLNHKYLRNFQIIQHQLVFPMLRLLIQSYDLHQQYKTKNSLLIERMFEKIITTKTSRKQLKKKSHNSIGTLHTDPSQPTTNKLDMRTFLNNSQCNQVILYNLNQNFIPHRYILKMLHHLQKLQRQRQQLRFQTSHAISEQVFQKSIHQNQTENSHNKQLATDFDPNINQPNQQVQSALRNYIISTIRSDGHDAHFDEFDRLKHQGERKQARKLTKRLLDKQPTKLNDNYTKQKAAIHYVIHTKLQSFTNYLIAMSETYDQPMLFTIMKTKTMKIKVNKSFYQLTCHKLPLKCYLMVMKDNRSEKQWVVYVSQKILNTLNRVTLHSEIKGINDRRQREGNSIAMRYCHHYYRQVDSSNEDQSFSRQLSSHNNLNGDNELSSQQQLQYDHMKYIQTYNVQSHLQSTTPSKQSPQTIHSILTTQSPHFHFSLLPTPYYNKLTIHRKHTNLYFVNRLNSKKNHFSLCINQLQMAEKKIIRLRDIMREGERQGYVYISCGYDRGFAHYRLDFYIPRSQQKLVALVPKDNVNSVLKTLTKKNTNKSNPHKHKLLTTLIHSKQLTIDLTKCTLTIANTPYKLFETFGQLTLHLEDVTQQHYQQMLFNNRQSESQSQLHSPPKTNPNPSPKSKLSGLIELLKLQNSLFLLLLDYRREKILSTQVEEDPENFFTNIYAEYSFKQSNNLIFQTLLRRLYQKVQNNSIDLIETPLDQFANLT